MCRMTAGSVSITIFLCLLLQLAGRAAAQDAPPPDTPPPDTPRSEDSSASTTAQPAAPASSGDLTTHIQWLRGPTTARFEPPFSAAGKEDNILAELQVPSGFKFAGADGARAFLTSIGNPPNPKTVGLLVPLGLNPAWVVTFVFEDIGRVPTENSGDIKPDVLIQRMKQGLERLNVNRRAAKNPEIADLEWIQEPTYDPKTHTLTWAVRGVVPGERGTANYDVRFLGKSGVMKATILTTGEKYESVISQAKPLLENFEFAPDQKYDAWKTGDKVAPIGLAEVVAGNPAANRGIVGFLKSDKGLLIVGAGVAVVLIFAVMIYAGLSLSKKQNRPVSS